MWENKDSQIEKQYRFEEDNNVYLIEVSLDDYTDVYDEWDPAPFRRRFIKAEFDDFIVSSSEDIPLEYNLNIVLYIPKEKEDEKKEKAVLAAYQNYYSYVSEKNEKMWQKVNGNNIYFFLLAVVFLSVRFLLQYVTNSVLFDVIKEGIAIGGWVSLWEVFTNIFIRRKQIKMKYKIIKRLCSSDIRFVYI
jgi:hypothetical protein